MDVFVKAYGYLFRKFDHTKAFSSLFVFLIVFIPSAFSCTCFCLDDCSFMNTAREAEFVFLGKVRSIGMAQEKYYGRSYVILEVIQQYKGSSLKKTINVLGGQSSACERGISTFKVGGHYLLAPYKVTESFFPERVNDNLYGLTICHSDYLVVNQQYGIAIGDFIKNEDAIDLVDLEAFGEIFEKSTDSLGHYRKKLEEERRQKKKKMKQKIAVIQSTREKYFLLLSLNFLIILLILSYIRFKRLD